MSEYQYYEFRAVDRPLTREERGELRSISTRAEITATSFTNEYNWGDLKASPRRLVEQYFDAHFYLANWGSRTLMFRFPEQIVSAQVLAPYSIDEAVDVWSSGKHTVVAFHMPDDDYYEDQWWEHENALGDLIELRDHIMRGDLRCLYMAWLNQAARLVGFGQPLDEFDDLPIPAGLGERNAALERFASVFALDLDVIAAASSNSEPLGAWEEAQRSVLEDFVTTLPAQVKDELLLRMAQQDPGARLELIARFHQSGAVSAGSGTTPSPTLDELIEQADRLKSERERQERLRREREIAARKKAEAERRQQRLDALATNWDEHWNQVFEAIDERKRPAYRRAAALMAELGDAASNPAQIAEFGDYVRALRDEYANRPALMEEMDEAGLAGE